MTGLVASPRLLSSVVRFDRVRLGSIIGQKVLHLQCHIGTDTLSLARLGAIVTGLDFSAASLSEAIALFEAAGQDGSFVESTVYDALEHLPPSSFDLVYTGVGALCWLPDIQRWAEIVAGLLRPGARFFMRETHPVFWSAADPVPEGLQARSLPYGATPDAQAWITGGTYVRTEDTFTCDRTLEWNHSTSEVINALLGAGMVLTRFVEHHSLPWNALPGRMVPVAGTSEWELADRPERIPHSYTVEAMRSGA